VSKQAVKLIGEGLGIGESTEMMECPFCLAGHEKKFSVSRNEQGLLYGCFRASCSAAGFVPTGFWEGVPSDLKPVKKRKPYIWPLSKTTGMDHKFFTETWGLYPTQFKVTERDEYAFPILNPDGFRKGYVIRQPVWKGRECHRKGVPGKPKALTYKDEPHYSRLSWAPARYVVPNRRVRNTQHVVIVEDILSAWKIAQSTHVSAVALNGANLGYEEVKEIAGLRPALVTVWLDPDATTQAYRIQSKWGLSFNHCSVITSDADPKDISEEVIKEKLADAGFEGDLGSTEQ
jgi:hypothetical protein